MGAEPYYFRPATWLYALQSHPTYWFCVGRSEETQAIIGMRGDEFVTITFEPGGDLTAIERANWACEVVGVEVHLPLLREIFLAYVERRRACMGLSDAPIRIHRFFDQGLWAGIEDVADDLKEFALDQEGADRAEREDLEDSLAWWREEGQYVFWWGPDHWVNEQGEVVAS